MSTSENGEQMCTNNELKKDTEIFANSLTKLGDTGKIEKFIYNAFMEENREMIDAIRGSWFDDNPDYNFTLEDVVKKKIDYLLELYKEEGYSSSIFGYSNSLNIHEIFISKGHKPNEFILDDFEPEDVHPDFKYFRFELIKHRLSLIDDYSDLSYFENVDLTSEDYNGNELLYYFAHLPEIGKFLIEQGNSLLHSNNMDVKPVDIIPKEIKNLYIMENLLDMEMCYMLCQWIIKTIKYLILLANIEKCLNLLKKNMNRDIQMISNFW